MNRCDKRIIERLKRGKTPTAYDPFDDADREVMCTIMTKAYDYTKKGQIVIFENDERETDDPRVLAGEEMETGEGGVRSGGLLPTLTAEMGGHGNNYAYILEGDDEDRNDTKRSDEIQ